MDEFTSLLNQIQAITSGVETLQSMNDLNHILDSLEFKNVPVSLLIQFFEKIPENYKKQINHSYIYDVISNNFQTLSPLLTYIDFNKLNKKQQVEIIYESQNHISNEISIPQSYFRNIHNTNQKNLIHIQSLEKKKLQIEDQLQKQQQIFSTNLSKISQYQGEIEDLKKQILLIILKCFNIIFLLFYF